MSQRSLIVQSGSIAISACSAACSVPSSFGIASSPSSCHGSGTNQIASVDEARRRAVERHELDPLLRADRLALVADDLLGHLDLAEHEVEPHAPLLAQRPHDLGLRLVLGLRVPVAAERLDDRAHRRLVQLVHEVRLAQVEVDGALVHGRVRARALDQRRAPRRSRRRRPRTRPARPSAARRAPRGSPCRPRRTRPSCGAAPGRRLRRRAPRARGSRRRASSSRRLERGRADVPGEDARARGVEQRRLDAPAEQLVGLAHEVLVEPVLARDQHREPVPAPPRAAPLLAQRRDRAGEADRDHRVEQPDVDPELERVRRRHAEQVALAEPPLDLAPLPGVYPAR